MTPTMEEVAGWLREAATECEDFRDWLESTGHTALASDKEDQGIVFRSRAAQVEAMGWRPIEDAPRDGTWILAVNAKTNPGRQHVVHHSERHSGKFPWVTDSAPMSFVDGLTHWMPLLQPPVNK